MRLKTFLLSSGFMAVASTALAQNDWEPGFTLFGTPGLIEMPSGISQPVGQFSITLGGFELQQRGTLSFQITDRLSGSFRYSRIDQFNGIGKNDTFDRSFDFRYRLLNEGRFTPAVTVGLIDFLGTGRFSSEYLAATKHLSPNLRATVGLGWGRLGSYNGFDNPLSGLGEEFEDRPEIDFGEGGTVATDQFFRGDAAFFGGLEYRLNDRWSAAVEYSSDGYTREDGFGTYDHNSPMNYAVTWQPRDEYLFKLAYLNGSTLAFGATFTVNPAERPSFGGRDPAPVPVAVRPYDARAAATWDRSELPEATLREIITQTLATEGMQVSGIELSDRQVRIRYENTRYRAEAQAMGRINRILSQAMPPSIEVFVLEPTRNGTPTNSATFRRADLERLENEVGATEASFAATAFRDAAGSNAGLVSVQGDRPNFVWSLGPYFAVTAFNPDAPLAPQVGLQFDADYYLRPNIVASTRIRYEVLGSDDEPKENESPLQRVRTDGDLYGRDDQPTIEQLTLAHYGRPGRDLYSRVTAGYLERMFGGLSAEVLWKPVGSRLALGAEVNYVAQRDFDVLFGFQDYEVMTGHASAYYDFGNGFHGQIDAGRYLAGDWGATVTLDREFANGWAVGAFVTRTDVSFEDFGEGSFDKGLRITIPTDWLIGTPTQHQRLTRLRSLERDGGARLNVEGRLYEAIRDTHTPELEQTWGRYWR